MYGGLDIDTGVYEVDPRANSYYRDLKDYYEPAREYQMPESRRSINPRRFDKNADYHPMGFDGGCSTCDSTPQTTIYKIDTNAIMTELASTKANTVTIINMLYILIVMVAVVIIAIAAIIIQKIYKRNS